MAKKQARFTSILDTAASAIEEINASTSDIESSSREVTGTCEHFAKAFQTMSERMSISAQSKDDATGELRGIAHTTDELVLGVSIAGLETQDSRYVQMIEERARQISGVFDAALDSGEISLDDLFDHDYQPILGTDPEQVMTRFTEFTDCVLTPIHEEIVETCDSIIYSACVDKNGYLQRTTGNSPSHRATIQSGIPRIAAIGGSSMIGRACALRGKRSRCSCKHTGVIWAAANS